MAKRKVKCNSKVVRKEVVEEFDRRGISFGDDFNITYPSDKRLVINFKPYKEMFHYVQAAQSEVSGLGKVVFKGDLITITDIVIFNQNSSVAYTELDQEALAKFLVALVRRGKDPSQYKLWWHSHNDFGVSWSSVDEDNIRRLAKGSMVVSTCMNKMGDLIGRFDKGRKREDLPISIQPTGGFVSKGECYRRVKRKIKEEIEVYQEPVIVRDNHVMDIREYYRKLMALSYY